MWLTYINNRIEVNAKFTVPGEMRSHRSPLLCHDLNQIERWYGQA